jgi:hypothetical protein
MAGLHATRSTVRAQLDLFVDAPMHHSTEVPAYSLRDIPLRCKPWRGPSLHVTCILSWLQHD